MKTQAIVMQSGSWKEGDEVAQAAALEAHEKTVRDVMMAENRIRMFDRAKWAMMGTELPEIIEALNLRFNSAFDFIEPYIAEEDPRTGIASTVPNPDYANALYALRFHSSKGFDQINFNRRDGIAPALDANGVPLVDVFQMRTRLEYELPEFAPVFFIIVTNHRP